MPTKPRKRLGRIAAGITAATIGLTGATAGIRALKADSEKHATTPKKPHYNKKLTADYASIMRKASVVKHSLRTELRHIGFTYLIALCNNERTVEFITSSHPGAADLRRRLIKILKDNNVTDRQIIYDGITVAASEDWHKMI
jgi:hypothetical protein